MKKSKRFEPVKKMAQEKEAAAAVAVGKAQQEKNACLEQLVKLQNYRDEYVTQFKTKGQAGMSAARLNEYQMFVQKIDVAIKEQQQAVDKAGSNIQLKQQHMQQSNRRKKVVEKLIDKNIKQENIKADRTEQNVADDRPRGSGSMNDVLMWRLS